MTKEKRGNSAVSGRTKNTDGERVKVDRDVQAKLGTELREMYNAIVREGVPDRFVDLLENLEKAGKAGEEEKSPK